jgi:ribonuclease BN (tRNA processing enzyme)
MLDDDHHLVVLDAGTGITALGETIGPEVERVDVLLSHLHMDHILGLGFFQPLFTPGLEVHLWGPPSTTLDLHDRLTRYLSPPLFPVVLRDLPCELHLHDTPMAAFDLAGVTVRAALVCHPGPTVGYRLDDGQSTMAYLSDHEPALMSVDFPGSPEWTSGYGLAAGVDLLIHDAQYLDDQYVHRLGWGHSSISHALAFAELCRVRHLVAFHHDPARDDAALDRIYAGLAGVDRPFTLTAAREGAMLAVATGERLDTPIGDAGPTRS